MNNWSEKSINNLNTLDPDLRILCNTMLQIHDCSILWGYRDAETQNEMYDKGWSKLRFPESNHNKYFSEAVDLAPYLDGKDPYGDVGYTKYFAGLVLGTASMLYQMNEMKRKIRWGGSWSVERKHKFASFFDVYHFELWG